MATASGSKSSKRKRVVLSIDDKIEVLKLIDNGTSYTVIMEKYGIRGGYRAIKREGILCKTHVQNIDHAHLQRAKN